MRMAITLSRCRNYSSTMSEFPIPEWLPDRPLKHRRWHIGGLGRVYYSLCNLIANCDLVHWAIGSSASILNMCK